MSSILLQLIAFSNLFFIAAMRTAVVHTRIRCSSREAAELIQNKTANDDFGSLLVVTCDASGRGGGSKHDGMASVLRIRHGVALLHRQQAASIRDDDGSTISTGDNSSSQQSSSPSGTDEKEDLIETISRRTVPSRTSSEVAAIALGVKHAIKTVPLSLRDNVLILSDSEFALDFYCGEKSYDNRHQQTTRRRTSSSKKRRGKRHQPTRTTELREESYLRLFTTLLTETTPGGVFLSKIKSSSRSVGLDTGRTSMESSATQSSSWDGKGFLDHDACDYLSSDARYVSNSSEDEDANAMMLDLSSNNGLDNYSPFRAVIRLTPDDLKWLSYSENDKVGPNNKDIWNEIIVKGSDAREDRRKRKEHRIESIKGLLEG